MTDELRNLKELRKENKMMEKDYNRFIQESRVAMIDSMISKLGKNLTNSEKALDSKNKSDLKKSYEATKKLFNPDFSFKNFIEFQIKNSIREKEDYKKFIINSSLEDLFWQMVDKIGVEISSMKESNWLTKHGWR